MHSANIIELIATLGGGFDRPAARKPSPERIGIGARVRARGTMKQLAAASSVVCALFAFALAGCGDGETHKRKPMMQEPDPEGGSGGTSVAGSGGAGGSGGMPATGGSSGGSGGTSGTPDASRTEPG